MFQFFSSFGASSNFERYRLEITTKSFDAPSEQSLRNVSNTFCGQDPQTKSQIAYATIIKKLLTSDSKNNWIYLLKNLIILDRIVQENLFTEEISDLSIATLDSFKELDQKNYVFDTERVISSYWRLIKEKSAILNSEKHIFSIKRSQRTDFLSKLTLDEKLKQIQTIENFFALTYEFIQYFSGKKLMDEHPQLQDKILKGRQQFNKSKLMEFLCLQVLNKLMLYYSCQLQCNNNFLLVLTKDSENIKQEDIKRFKRHIVRFKQNANQYIRYVENRKHIKGFEQVNYKELNPYEIEDILKLLDEFMMQKKSQNHKHIFETLTITQGQMRVEKKPFADLNTDVLVPRIKQRQSHKPEQVAANSFSNWVNSFSNVFPQTQILSVDLIMQIKRQEENKENQQMPIDQSNRDSCVYNNRDTNISNTYQITDKVWQKILIEPINFTNIFSKLANKWNF